MYMCMYVNMYVHHVHVVPAEARRGRLIIILDSVIDQGSN